ncbi:MAG: beta-ketoacyl-[acyl-carrier-protein] synthase family protein [Candidatus Omnitrophica bacterium]|nr:beta-ketoacyl-[acyl-carrier-protein] synthase family protein [Candidatus Omnitrophota bacterium]
MKKKVVVVGVGVVSSIGIGKKNFWEALISGKSGISKVESIDISGCGREYGGEIKNFNPLDFMTKKEAKSMGRASQLAIAATSLALEDAKLKLDLIRKEKVAVIFGTTMGEANVIEVLNRAWVKKGLEKIHGFLVPRSTANLISVNVGIKFGLSGINLVIPTACAAGNYAIGYGFDLISEGEVDVAICGGSDAFSRIAFVGFSRLYAMSPDICQPFDKNRKGMLLGEGSAVLILTSEEFARKLNLFIYSRVLGYGLSCDAHHMTIPSEDGIARCIKNALERTNVNIFDVDYISAHGTGTLQNDRNECLAIKNVFGDHYKKVPVSSIKSMLGHCMGAASSIEAASCVLSITEGIIPPTINYYTPDPECDIDCVPNVARKKEVNIALNNGYAFGGNNACVVFSKYRG